MHQDLRKRVKGAENDMKQNPNERKPACPIPAAQHEDSAQNRDKSNEGSQDDFVIERRLELELGGVVSKSDDAGSYEQGADDSN